MLVILHLRSAITNDLLAITSDTSQAAVTTLGQSLDSAFAAITAAIQQPDGNTNNHIADIQTELAAVCHSSRKLLDAIASGYKFNVETEMLFAQNATDVETLMRSVAFAGVPNNIIDCGDDEDDDAATIPTATPLFVLTNALALVHSVHQRCALVIGHPMHLAHAIALATESMERLYADTLRRTVGNDNNETALHLIISTYAQSVRTKPKVGGNIIEEL